MLDSNGGVALIAAALSCASLALCLVAMVLPPTAFNENGFLDTAVWNDINFPATSLGKGASAPEAVNSLGTNIEVLAFDGGVTTEQLYGNGELLHDWKEGTDIYFHIHWYPSTADAGNVTWQLEYELRDTAAFSGSTTINVTQATSGVGKLHRADFPAINCTGYKIGSQIIFRLFRAPTATLDNYEHDAYAVSIGIHYQVDSLGSRSMATK
jgi:hypothetical protein